MYGITVIISYSESFFYSRRAFPLVKLNIYHMHYVVPSRTITKFYYTKCLIVTYSILSLGGSCTYVEHISLLLYSSLTHSNRATKSKEVFALEI